MQPAAKLVLLYLAEAANRGGAVPVCEVNGQGAAGVVGLDDDEEYHFHVEALKRNGFIVKSGHGDVYLCMDKGPSPTPPPPSDSLPRPTPPQRGVSGAHAGTHVGAPALEPTFKDAMAAYPKRIGGTNPRGAEKGWQANIKKGHTPQEMYDGAVRYAAFMEATGKAGTEYVMQASTFFGPQARFLEPWVLPLSWAGTGKPGAPANDDPEPWMANLRTPT